MQKRCSRRCADYTVAATICTWFAAARRPITSPTIFAASIIIGIWWPTHVFQAAENLNKLLGAVHESLWWLFGAGYLGYTGARSLDKWRGPVR